MDTVAVGAVLIAYNWPKTNVGRYERIQPKDSALYQEFLKWRQARGR